MNKLFFVRVCTISNLCAFVGQAPVRRNLDYVVLTRGRAVVAGVVVVHLQAVEK